MMRLIPASSTIIVSRLPSRIYNKNTARSFFQAAGPKLLLPTSSFWDNVWDAVQGCWSAVTDEKSRDDFETLIKDGVIRDQVLQNAVNGSTLTFGLFHQLSNPLWEKHGFKAKEFVQAVGPALTNLHDVLHSLQDKFSKTALEQEQDRQAKLNDSTLESSSDSTTTIESMTSALDAEYLQSGNLWRTRAHAFEAAKANELLEKEKDSSSSNTNNIDANNTATETVDQDSPPSADELAASLVKMTTPGFLDAAYLGWKLSMMALIASSRISNSSSSAIGGGKILYHHQRPTYEEGSFQIGQVAILRARVMSISGVPTTGDDDGNENSGDTSKDKIIIEDDATFKANGEKDNISSKTRNKQGDGDDQKWDQSSDNSFGVAAQIDVLYEATSTFMELPATVLDQSTDAATASSSADSDEASATSTKDTTDSSSSSDKINVKEDEITATVNVTVAKDGAANETDKDNGSSSSNKDKPPAMDRIRVDSVGVAVLEGWFQGGPGPEKELRWRVAALRDPYEFPGAIPLHRTILKEGSGKN